MSAKTYFSNTYAEELEHYCAFLDLGSVASMDQATEVLIDLEKYLFQDSSAQQRNSFANHNFDEKELKNRFNSLVSILAQSSSPQHRTLFINLAAVRGSVSEELYQWSYYSHKFAVSQGKDTEAMNKWHEIESKLDTNQIARFKARTEANLAFYVYVIENSQNFDRVLFAAIDPAIRAASEFGHDVSEEIYIKKVIAENNLESKCKIVSHNHGSALLSFAKRSLQEIGFNSPLRGHIVSNSQNLDPSILAAAREIFAYHMIQEVDLADTDFVLVINDLDLLSSIPLIDTEKPIVAVDFSAASSPNFPYILLKDDGFGQVYAFSKRREAESYGDVLARALVPMLLSFARGTKFTEQIAVNYMDDYFGPLSKAMGKSLKDFVNPINVLAQKLEPAKD